MPERIALIDRDVTDDIDLISQAQALFIEGFPKYERYDFDLMCALARSHKARFLAYFDGPEMIGFSFSFPCGPYHYVLYLTVSPDQRSHGYGSLILNQLKQTHPDKQVLLDVEHPCEGAPNNDQRLSRIRFYKRNGFHHTGYVFGRDPYAFLLMSQGSVADVNDALPHVAPLLNQLEPDYFESIRLVDVSEL